MEGTTTSRTVSLVRILFFTFFIVLLVLTSVRLMLTESFVKLEYAQPGFPPDIFGFTEQDRLYWAPIALEYLLNDEGIVFLAELVFENGSAVYNARELKHMSDVKAVTQGALIVWQASGVGLILLSIGIGFVYGLQTVAEILRESARLTILVMVVLVVGILVGFSILFVGFHRIFFEGNTWIFDYSDTLIRLFPERFWQAAFVFTAFITILQASLFWLLGKTLLKRSSKPSGRS
jgi:integral membrane protein (TIGR01906 family)